MATETAAPAPAATPAASSQAVTVATPPVVDVSTAARTLAAARVAHREALAKGAAPADPKATGAAGTAPGTDGKNAATSNADATAAPGAASASAEDDEIAVLIEAQRAHKDTERKLETRTKDLDAREAALKEHEQHIPAIKAARDAMSKGDVMGAMTAVFGRELVLKEVFFELSKHIDAHGDDATPPVDLDAEFEKRFAAREAEKAAEAERKANEGRAALAQARDSHDQALGAGFGAALMGAVKTIQVGGRELPLSSAPPEVLGSVVAGYANYVSEAFATFRADPTKYPGLSKFRPTAADVVEKVEAMRTAPGGKVPLAPELLKAMEADIEAEIRRTPYAAPAPAPTPTPGSVNSSWQRSEGAVVPAAGGPVTIDDKREAHRQALRGARA